MTPFQGVINDEEISNLIAYMKSISVHVEQPAEGEAGEDAPSQTSTEEEG